MLWGRLNKLKLLGRLQALKVLKVLKQYRDVINEKIVTYDLLHDITGVRKRTLAKILRYLEVLGELRFIPYKGQAGIFLKLADTNYEPNQDEIDLAAIAVGIVDQKERKHLFVRAGKNGGLTPNILLGLYLLYKYETTCIRKQRYSPLSLLNNTTSIAFLDEAFELKLVSNDKLELNYYIRTRDFHAEDNLLSYIQLALSDISVLERYIDYEVDSDMYTLKRTFTLSWTKAYYIVRFADEYIDLNGYVNDLRKFGLLTRHKVADKRYTKAEFKSNAEMYKRINYEMRYYNVYDLVIQKHLFLHKLFSNEEKMRIARKLFRELKNQNPLSTFAYGDAYENALVKAALTGLFYGYIPYGMGLAHINKYLNGLKKYITKEDEFVSIKTRLLDPRTRYHTVMTIYTKMAEAWRLIASGQSQVSDIILQKIDETWVKYFTKKEKKLLHVLHNMFSKQYIYEEMFKRVFKRWETLELKDVIAKGESLITKDTITYHYVLIGLTTKLYSYRHIVLNSLAYQWAQIHDFRRDTKSFYNVDITLQDLAKASFADNLRNLYRFTKQITNFAGKYQERWDTTDFIQQIFVQYTDLVMPRVKNSVIDNRSLIERALDYLIEKEKNMTKEQKENIKRIYIATLNFTNRIWNKTIYEIAEQIIDGDVDLFINALNYFREKYSVQYRRWHGIGIVNLILHLINMGIDNLKLIDEIVSDNFTENMTNDVQDNVEMFVFTE